MLSSVNSLGVVIKIKPILTCLSWHVVLSWLLLIWLMVELIVLSNTFWLLFSSFWCFSVLCKLLLDETLMFICFVGVFLVMMMLGINSSYKSKDGDTQSCFHF